PHRGIEEHETLDALGSTGCELECEAAAEAVADDVDARELQRVECVDEIVDVRTEVPGWLPVGKAVPAQIRREDVERPEPVFGEPAKAAAPARDSVEAEQRRRVRWPPIVHVQPHAWKLSERARRPVRHPREP